MAKNSVAVEVAILKEQTKSQQKEIDNLSRKIVDSVIRLHDKYDKEISDLKDKIEKLATSSDKKSVIGSLFKVGG